MNAFWRRLTRYPVISVTVIVGIVGVSLALTGAEPAARWTVSIFALVIAGIESVTMVRSLLRGSFGIDVLAVTAIIATVLVGEYWASLIIVLMFSGGEALEDYAAGRAKRELTALLDRSPQFAHRQRGNDTADVPVGELDVDDTVIVKPGELVPVDGALLSEAATLDESSLTGESLPVERARDDILISGSVNGALAL
ncbi:MAG: heavy metal translocating P-type ATPase, partial [Actinomycetales bacterium]|nr:heavy metal translocating P-type ATPase [Actinomycetales bacterium]